MLTVLPEQAMPLYALVELLHKHPRGLCTADRLVYQALTGDSDTTRPCTRSLDVAIDLIPTDWWWHLSHLEACVCPTTRLDDDVPFDDPVDYRISGMPIRYRATLWHGKEEVATGLCKALLLARCALLSKAAAVSMHRRWLVQTGDGPMMVDVNGRLKELPMGMWLDADGKLVPREDIPAAFW